MSATVGNPADLLRWVQGSVAGSRPGHVLAPDDWLPSEVTSYPALDTEAGVFEGDHSADVQLDYVGSAENATRVIAAALDSLGQHPQIGLGNGCPQVVADRDLRIKLPQLVPEQVQRKPGPGHRMEPRSAARLVS